MSSIVDRVALRHLSASDLSIHLPAKIEEMVTEAYLKTSTLKFEMDQMHEIPDYLQPFYDQVNQVTVALIKAKTEAHDLRMMTRKLFNKRAAGFGLGKMRDDTHITIEGRGVYAHVWFDADVARTDAGNRAPTGTSGEWQVIISTSPDSLNLRPRGKELARKEFRFVETRSRQWALNAAEEFIQNGLIRHGNR